MTARVAEADVRDVIDADPNINMDSFIASATALTDYVASKDSASILNSNLLFQIELHLAAHFYARRDPQYRSKSTGKASASFQGQSGMGLDGTDWGQDAMLLDVTRCLAALNKGGKVGLFWLGTNSVDDPTATEAEEE